MLKVQVLSYNGHTKIVLLFFPCLVPFSILKLHAGIITVLSVCCAESSRWCSI